MLSSPVNPALVGLTEDQRKAYPSSVREGLLLRQCTYFLVLKFASGSILAQSHRWLMGFYVSEIMVNSIWPSGHDIKLGFMVVVEALSSEEWTPGQLASPAGPRCRHKPQSGASWPSAVPLSPLHEGRGNLLLNQEMLQCRWIWNVAGIKKGFSAALRCTSVDQARNSIWIHAQSNTSFH